MEKVKDMDVYFENYMGNLFSRIAKHSKKQIDVAMELAPGFRIKGAYALRELGFKGTLYVLDTNDNVLDYITEIYQIILPEAKIVGLQYSLKDAVNHLPSKIDLFMSNHPLDDMIIFEYLDNSAPAFDNNETSKQVLLDTWDALLSGNDLENIKKKIIAEWQYFLDKIDVDLFILSQYKSAYYMMKRIDSKVRDVFLELKKLISSNDQLIDMVFDFDFEDFDAAKEEGFSLKENIQNSKNWIVKIND